MKNNKVVKGYKAFDKDLRCLGFQYRVGSTYVEKEPLKICETGFHFCSVFKDVFKYYAAESATRICEVEAIGKVIHKEDKSCTSKIKIVRELTPGEIEARTDNFKFNSGNQNSGNYNSGNQNAGIRNSGHLNSGNQNSGIRNSGHLNAGNYNSGNLNAGNYNSGFFNTNTPTMRLFNKDTGLSFDSPQGRLLRGVDGNLYSKIKSITRWCREFDMTEDEKSENPSYITTGGFLKKLDKIDYSGWNNEEDLAFFMSLPNFDADIFYQITGIDVRKPKTIKVTCNGQEFEINLDKAK